MPVLFKNARILKMDDTPLFLSNIVVDKDRIAYIGDDYSKFGPFDTEIECDGNVIMPGFKNAHSHSAMTFLRSKTDSYTLHDWLFKIVFPREDCLINEDVYHLSKIAFLEYLTSGITACFDQYFYSPFTGKAAEEMGMRIVLQGVINNQAEQQKVVDLFHNYNSAYPSSLVTYRIGLHAEYTASEEALKATLNALEETKSPFYIHISETKTEVEDCFKRRNMSPVDYFYCHGFYKYGGGGYHCIHFTERDIEIFKDNNLTAITCPGSNAKLDDGIFPYAKMKDMGINIALGTDGPASNNCLDFFKEMSLVYSLSNLTSHDVTKINGYDILKMATVNGAKAMGLDECDILEVGKKADLIEIDLHRPNMQPLNDIVNNIVYSGSKDNIKTTMINGKILYRNRHFFVNDDVENIYQQCQMITERIEKEIQK